MRWIALCILLAVPCFSAEPVRVPCNAQNRGRLWPEQANTDPAVARQAGRCGELQICSVRFWKHGWQPLTVNVSQFGAARQTVIPGCAQKTPPPPERETEEQVTRP